MCAMFAAMLLIYGHTLYVIWQCFTTFCICTLNASKVIFVTFNLNYGLHAGSVGKPSEQMDVKFLDSSVILKPNPNRFSVFRTSLQKYGQNSYSIHVQWVRSSFASQKSKTKGLVERLSLDLRLRWAKSLRLLAKTFVLDFWLSPAFVFYLADFAFDSKIMSWR